MAKVLAGNGVLQGLKVQKGAAMARFLTNNLDGG